MSIAKVLAPVTGVPRDATIIKAAIAVAKPFNAHVVALFVRPDSRLSVPYMGGAPMSPTVVQDIVDAIEKLARDAEARARATLSSIAKSEDLKVVDHPEKAAAVTCSFEAIIGLFPPRIAEAASLSDLVVFGPLSHDDGPDIAESFLEALTTTQRPVLICPEAMAQAPKKIVIGWDGGNSAAHSVCAAIPFLERAETVEILSVQHEGRHVRFRALETYLALHGIKATHQTVEKGTKNTGQALLEAAGKAGADLLVMGGYGHNYWRETLFGGVTAFVRWHANVPVLLMH
jgi:nucleotide-binding universal stress UspA family protein